MATPASYVVDLDDDEWVVTTRSGEVCARCPDEQTAIRERDRLQAADEETEKLCHERFLLILNDGAPLLVLRVPQRLLKVGYYTHAVKWKTVQKASLQILKQHGMPRRSLLSLDHLAGPDDKDQADYERWRSVLQGGEAFPDFHLYEVMDDTTPPRLVRAALSPPPPHEGSR